LCLALLGVLFRLGDGTLQKSILRTLTEYSGINEQDKDGARFKT